MTKPIFVDRNGVTAYQSSHAYAKLFEKNLTLSCGKEINLDVWEDLGDREDCEHVCENGFCGWRRKK